MRILVAVDGSDQSLHAVRAVEHLAHAEKVVLMHALDVPTLAYPMYHTMGGPRTLEGLSLSIEQATREDGKRLLDRVVSLLLMDAGSVVKKLKKGLPGEVILTTAEKVEEELIVVGLRGLGRVNGRHVGRAELPRESSIRPHGAWDSGDGSNLNRSAGVSDSRRGGSLQAGSDPHGLPWPPRPHALRPRQRVTCRVAPVTVPRADRPIADF